MSTSHLRGLTFFSRLSISMFIGGRPPLRLFWLVLVECDEEPAIAELYGGVDNVATAFVKIADEEEDRDISSEGTAGTVGVLHCPLLLFVLLPDLYAFFRRSSRDLPFFLGKVPLELLPFIGKLAPSPLALEDDLVLRSRDNPVCVSSPVECR